MGMLQDVLCLGVGYRMFCVLGENIGWPVGFRLLTVSWGRL